VSLNISFGDDRPDIEAIEFTYVYESDELRPRTLGHGYIVVLNETVFFVQHTSRHPITSELALDMICDLVSRQLNEGGLPLSYGPPEVLGKDD
jgi:hypothetical protein